MTETITDTAALPLPGANWSNPIDDGIRRRVRGFIEAIIEEELESVLGLDRRFRWRHDHRRECKWGNPR